MCIAILNTYGTLSFDALKNSWENNDDGAGLLYVENGVLCAFKELNSFKKFYGKYKSIRAKSASPIVLHFRIGTHGDFSVNNLHPFMVNPKIGFVHNGIIRVPEIEKTRSDTWHFNALVLQLLKKPENAFVENSRESALIQGFIGSSSKLIFLNEKNEFSIFNEHLGHWDKSGNWFSNSTYKTSRYIDRGGVQYEKPAYYGHWYKNAPVVQSKPAPVAKTTPAPALENAHTYKPAPELEAIGAMIGIRPEDSKFQIEIDRLKKMYKVRTLADLQECLIWGAPTSSHLDYGTPF
jgi:predicted glutamine amidotransferase